MPAMPPRNSSTAGRVPPASQPIMPNRNQSAFPSLHRPRALPPSFTGRAPSRLQTPNQAQTQAQTQSQTPWRELPQSQRPSDRLDNRYSPPSSQPTQLFASQSRSQRQVSRPPSSQRGLVDHYRPDSISVPVPVPRSAMEVYQDDRPGSSVPVLPKPQKGVEILEKIAGLYSMIEERFAKKEEDDTEFQEALEDRFKGIEDENKDLKERLHELTMGQKVLPTKGELNEEIASQLGPALHEYFETLTETFKKDLTPMPEETAELAAGKVKSHMLEMQDLARKEAVREGAMENPLMTLLNHLITKLGPLDDITTTLESLSGLPEALEQVAVFQETMQAMQNRIATRAEPQPQPQPQTQVQVEQVPPSISTQITKLQETIDEVRKKVEAPPLPAPPAIGLDSGKVFGAITGLKRGLEEVKAFISTGGAYAGSTDDANGEMKEMRDVVMALKAEILGMKNTLANLTLPAPSTADATVDKEITDALRAVLDEIKDLRAQPTLKQVPAVMNGDPNVNSDVNSNTFATHGTEYQIPTPTTGIRSSPEDIHPARLQTEPEAAEQSPLRVLGRPIRATPWATQDPSAKRLIAKRNAPLEADNAQAGGSGTDIFGAIQPVPSIPTSKKRKTPPKPTLGSELPIYKNTRTRSQSTSQTSSRNTSHGSVANKAKTRNTSNGAVAIDNRYVKQKTSQGDTREVKEEGMKGLGVAYTTRSEAKRGLAAGVDIINLDSGSESSGKKSGRIGGPSSNVAPVTPHPGDTTRSLGPEANVAPPYNNDRLTVGTQDQPIEIESLPLPDTQDLGQGESQLQAQVLPLSQGFTQTQNQTQTQLNNSQTDSTFEFGYGQLPSVPSLPAYDSTVDTQVDTCAPETRPEQKNDQDVVTSTELVEQSLALRSPSQPKRAEPGYRKYQAKAPKTYGGNSKMHGFLKGNFGLLEDSDDE